jgi:hypothetical protein
VVIAKPVARLRELDEGTFFIGAMLHRIDGETQWRTGFHFPGQDPSVFGVESRVEQADDRRGADSESYLERRFPKLEVVGEDAEPCGSR